MKRLTLIPFAMLLLVSSCDVHEFPGVDEPAPPVPAPVFDVSLDVAYVDPDMELLRVVDADSPESRASQKRSYDLRCRLMIESITDEETHRSYPRAGSKMQDFTSSGMGVHDFTAPLSLEAGTYRIVAFADYVPEGTTDDFHHDTSDFSSITLRGTAADRYEHAGSDESRDNFRGLTTFTVDDLGRLLRYPSGEPLDRAVIEMHRPVARFEFVARDVGKFREHHGLPARASSNPAEDPAYDYSGYGVRFSYAGYMPSTFNAYSNKPVDSRTGVGFESDLTHIDASHARLGFDYVFVNGSETSVPVRVEIYDRTSGKSLTVSQVIDVPLSRNKLTVVTGDFLTAKTSGGLGIDPDFTGEFNIEIK